MTAEDDAANALRAGLEALKIPDSDRVCSKILEFGAILLRENQQTNLTGARDLGTLVKQHFLDSLAPLRLVDLLDAVIDLGSGAGLPGVPAAVAYPAHAFILLEPRALRVRFLNLAISELRLDNITVMKSSALGPAAAGLFGSAGTVLARAVAEPAAAFRLGLPLLRAGGAMILYAGRSAKATSEEREVARSLGGGGIRCERVAVPFLDAVRHAWIVVKVTQ